MTGAITMRGLVKQYPNGVRGVDGIDLSIKEGEFFALLGPSGCGKTTLLRTIAGLETITEGTLHIGGVDMTNVEPGERGVAMVFQDYALFPHMDVSDNIAYPLRVRKVPRSERKRIAADAAAELSLEELLERRPGQLSGGQQQRVALARAIATRPEVLLLDEPLSNLDARLRLEARTFLKELQRELGVTSVFVTHDQAEALALADRIAVMKDGKIQQVGTPREIFHAPANEFVASFIGAHPMNLIDGVLHGGRIASMDAAIPAPSEAVHALTDGARVTWGVRPEYVGWSPADVRPAVGSVPAIGAIAGQVCTVENLGAHTLLTMRAGADRLQAVVGEDPLPKPGQRCWFTFPMTKVLVFETEGGTLIGGGSDNAFG
ncbi:ABC transporter ATP-binding protein [Actinomyces ruminicola]|uniref:ABC-type sugar transport system, ATPase component n=1 Tax=Actinomyces ruminicola TaxID=332524 RepID=A0A1G9UJV6_9ACTO|nr:ABC transporter ATP-binding protein [Actinomyces ruminicola]SDM60200.1 ABC-type sugar transport system, ATPase component [Actinomyces ruminicola]